LILQKLNMGGAQAALFAAKRALSMDKPLILEGDSSSALGHYGNQQSKPHFQTGIPYIDSIIRDQICYCLLSKLGRIQSP
jgi:hypothetical protein